MSVIRSFLFKGCKLKDGGANIKSDLRSLVCCYITKLEESVGGGHFIKPDVRCQIGLSVLVPNDQRECLFCAKIDVNL